MIRLAIIGSNDLGKLIAHHAANNGWKVAGFFDNRKAVGTDIENYGKVLGNVDGIEDLFHNQVFDHIMVGVGYTQFKYRRSVFEMFKGKIPFANLIHKSSYVDSSVSLGEGIFMLPGCVLDMNVKIKDNVLLNTGCKIAHDSSILDHSFIGPGVTIAGNVVVDECCFLGVGSTILDNVHIPSATLIGGGAVVIKSIDRPGTYVGVPAKRLKDNLLF
jgi:sugar O-acyltransferase (sialic acid O-acetyltransferase NeuD family)